MAHEYDWRPDGVWLRFRGDVSGDEIDEANDGIRRHPDLARFKYVLADYAGVETLRMQPYQTLLTATRDHRAVAGMPRLKVALIATLPQVVDEFRRYAETPVINDAFEVRIFSDLAAAEHWACGR